MADDQHGEIGRRVVGALVARSLRRSTGQASATLRYARKRGPSPQRGQRPEKPRRIARPRSRCSTSPARRKSLDHRRRSFLARRVRAPLESISKRKAPAKGAASTSLTSTVSPSRNVSPVRVPTSARRASSKRKYSPPRMAAGMKPSAPVSLQPHEQSGARHAADPRREMRADLVAIWTAISRSIVSRSAAMARRSAPEMRSATSASSPVPPSSSPPASEAHRADQRAMDDRDPRSGGSAR